MALLICEQRDFMSKRSSRRKRKQRQKKQKVRLTAPVLIQRGLTAFQQANYDVAIKDWEQARQKPSASETIAAPLAEAYFRRAMTAAQPRLTDLQQAAKLQPADHVYRYHLALAHHRMGELAPAESGYRRLLAETPPFKRAAVPLAQLLIDQKKSATKDPVWNELSPEEQRQLVAAEALVRNKAASTLQGLVEAPLHPLWHGLLAIALNDKETAQQNLQSLVDASSELHPLARGVACYYLGVLAAEAGQTEAALAHWQAARSGGLNSAHLRKNLSALAYERALKEQQAGQPQKAIELLEQVQAGSLNADLKDFYHQLNLDLGYAAAQQDNWQQALAYWQKAEQAGDDSRKLIFNLALAYQKQEEYWKSAEYWRTLLRRRPRKAGHPDALTDQQVARVWQNIAENYSKAGEYEESVKTYKNAVKWAPDNLDLRLKLVEAYQSEGRWQAAENELNRILEKDPDNIRALTLLAESYSDDYSPTRARDIWLRILELEPKNPIARQQLAHSYVEQGSRFTQWGQYQTAINILEEGLKYVPDNQRLLVMMGGAYADWGKLKQARQYLDQARTVNPNDLQTLHTIYQIWLYNESKPDLQQTFEHIKAVTDPIPGGFFLDLFHQCYEHDYEEEGEKLLKFAEEKYADDIDILVGVAAGYSILEQENSAMAILRRVLKKNPTHIEANIQLGILYHDMGQTRLAKRHWEKAESQASKENDPMALYKIKLTKDEYLYNKPPPTNPLEMLRDLPPQVRDELLKTAPPEIAALLRDMDPNMLDILLSMGGGLDDFDDDFFFDDDDEDEDDFYYV